MGLCAKITFVCLLLFTSGNIYSQNRRFHQITSQAGLSQSEVYCFLKDSRGFMWFGTVDGLNRFDGYNINIYNTERNNPASLSNNTVRSLTEDKWGHIWIGTDDGLNMYDPNTESISQIIPNSVSGQKLNVRTLLVYDSYLFLGTQYGLFRINLDEAFNSEKGFVMEPIILDNHSSFSNENIINLKECSLGGFWIQTSTSVSQIIVEPHSNRAIMVQTPIRDKSYNFFDLVEDNSDNLWISCNQSGLIRYHLTSKEVKTFKPSSLSNYGPSSLKCSGITSDLNGNIWIATLDNGLNLITANQANNETIQFIHIQKNPYNPSSLNSNLIRTLYNSSDDILWAGTIGAGINYFDADQKDFHNLRINTSSSNGSNFIRAIYMNSNDEVLAGAYSDGLYQINQKTKKTIKLGLGNSTVYYITPYQDNKYFICSDKGLSLIEVSNNQIKTLSQISTNAAFYIIKGKQDFYWLASFLGVYRLKIINNDIIIDKKYPLNTHNSTSPQNCRVLFLNSESDELFVGTEGDGLHILTLNEKQEVLKDVKYKSSDLKGSISNNYIRSIIQDSHGDFWIGTYEGLNKIENHSRSGNLTFTQFTKENGLPNNMINSIIEDNNQSLWIGTNKGLCKFTPSVGEFLNYYESDGIQSNEFSEHTAFKTDDGEIIMGGINGITTFFPNQIVKSKRSPQTTITDFYIDNERVIPNKKYGKHIPLLKGISISDTIILRPNQNNIAFDFSSMLYPSAEKIKYAFMLDGFDKNWQYTDASKRHANYTNLNHGKYRFMVKSTNSDGIWEEKGNIIYIHIKTPFKYSWYAYVLYLLIIVSIFVYFSYYSIIRYTTKNKLLLEQEHNHKVQSLNDLRTQFFINISHDLRTPLTLIKGPLESIIEENKLKGDTNKKLLLIRRNVKRLNYLIEQLLDVRKTESGKLIAKLEEHDIVAFTKKEMGYFNYAIHKKGLKYNIDCPEKKLIIAFDTDMLSKAYFNIISNALKYTEKGEINVLICKVNKHDYTTLNHSKYESFVKVEVRDTGKGISQENLNKIFERFYQENTLYGKGYGIGLSHTRQLIEAHEGYIEAESKEGHGTVIRFYIPNIHHSVTEKKETQSGEDDIYREDINELTIQELTQTNEAFKTILVVEDNADMRFYIKSELIKEYNVLEAEDGIEGIEKAENHDIDLIVSDVMMPNMDGMEFCKHIKSNLETSHIPVILLTAKTDKKSKYKGIETGADDYIPKPFEMEYLVLRIRNLLHSREQLRLIFQSRDTALEPSTVTVNSMDEKFLKDFMEAIEAGIPDAEFSVTSLEKNLAMSHSNFYRKIKSLTGQSAKEILNEMRMKRAKQILTEHKNIRIDEVAYMVGFTNPKYFGKSFKDVFGVSPTQMKGKDTSNYED